MAVAAANCINIPVMRQRELIGGVIVTDEEGNNLAKSKVNPQSCHVSIVVIVVVFQVAARVGISLVTLSRIVIVCPTMSECLLIFSYSP